MTPDRALRELENIVHKAIDAALESEQASDLFSDIAYVHPGLVEHMTTAAMMPLHVLKANQEYLKDEEIDLGT